MSKLSELVLELCPNGVEYKKLSEISEMKRGTSITRKDIKEGGIPVVSGGKEPAYYCNDYNRTGEIITVAGSGAGAGFVQYWNEPIFVCDAFSIKGYENISTKYLYYCLANLQEFIYSTQRGVGVPHVHISNIENIIIPTPPLPVQREIVRILDNFTELTSELTSKLRFEFIARKKQYEHYCDALLTFDDVIPFKTIGEISKYRRGSFPQPYTTSRFYGGKDAKPFVQVADIEEDSFLLKAITKNTISKIAQPQSVFVPKGTVICSIQGSIGKVAITQYDAYVDRTIAIFEELNEEVNKKYFAHCIKRKFSIEKNSARGSTIKTITKEEFTKFAIPLPSLEVQERVVNVLDKFESVYSNFNIELTAEIESRKKQYEFYRSKLLAL